jgi:hypothetical protein
VLRIQLRHKTSSFIVYIRVAREGTVPDEGEVGVREDELCLVVGRGLFGVYLTFRLSLLCVEKG